MVLVWVRTVRILTAYPHAIRVRYSVTRSGFFFAGFAGWFLSSPPPPPPLCACIRLLARHVFMPNTFLADLPLLGRLWRDLLRRRLPAEVLGVRRTLDHVSRAGGR